MNRLGGRGSVSINFFGIGTYSVTLALRRYEYCTNYKLVFLVELNQSATVLHDLEYCACEECTRTLALSVLGIVFTVVSISKIARPQIFFFPKLQPCVFLELKQSSRISS